MLWPKQHKEKYDRQFYELGTVRKAKLMYLEVKMKEAKFNWCV